MENVLGHRYIGDECEGASTRLRIGSQDVSAPLALRVALIHRNSNKFVS